MKSLFSEDTLTEINSRIASISQEQQPKWGQMNASQMLKHCQFPLEVALGRLPLEKPNVIKRTLFSLFKSSLYNDKPWKKSLPTAKEFIVTQDSDFDKEKALLIKDIQEFYAKKEQTEWPPHPMFGYFTRDQWGQMQYKHLDHHLTQFGA